MPLKTLLIKQKMANDHSPSPSLPATSRFTTFCTYYACALAWRLDPTRPGLNHLTLAFEPGRAIVHRRTRAPAGES